MSERLYEITEITDLKDMLNKTGEMYGDKIAYKIKIEEGKYKTISHKEVRNMINSLGTALIDIGLKEKRIAVIGENRYEWEIAYLSIVCGTGIVVPIDKALPENELKSVIERSEVEAIFYSNKYEKILNKIKNSNNNKLKYLISMDNEKNKENKDDKENTEEIYSQNELINKGKELIKNGTKEFINAEIDNKKMSIMLFTSGTTSNSKVVALSHKNICSNLMDIGSVLDVTSEDVVLSILHIIQNLNEYNVTVMACVPGIYERIFGMIRKKLEKQGELEEILEKEEKLKNASMQERKEVFKDIHDMLGGKVKLLISGAASLNQKIEEKYRLLGINLVQGYGLTETSPVIAVGTNKENKIGSVGKVVPSCEAKIVNADNEQIGELVVKGPNIALGYYNNKKATKESFKNDWFYTGDLAKIDEEGYIFICGRKKSVIVLKNGKNIFPEEMENLINQIEGIKESFVFGKQQSRDKENIKIHVKVVYDKEEFEQKYNAKTYEKIESIVHKKIKEINLKMPKYKAIRGLILTEEPLIKTTTNKIKRQANLDEITKSKN